MVPLQAGASALTPCTTVTPHTTPADKRDHMNCLSRRLGYANIQTTSIHLKMLPDTAGNLASVP